MPLPAPPEVGELLAACVLGEDPTGTPSTVPSVMQGRRGPTLQIERIVSCPDGQLALLSWLLPRCRNSPDRALCDQSIRRFLDSKDKDVCMVGALLRDAEPNELDLKGTAQRLLSELIPRLALI